MMISAKFLKSAINEYHPLLLCTKTFLRNQNCLTAPRVCNLPQVNTTVRNSRIHTTSKIQYPGKNWRKQQGRPANHNAYGPLTDGPDYSFLDGRPTPLGTGRLKRAKQHQELTSKIMKLTAEVDFAVANHSERVRREEEEREAILQSKLKPKGHIPPEAMS